MSRTKDPGVRAFLIDRAAQMLRARQPISLRSLVAGTGVSTMAVYTYFGGMDGLWKAMRQEGFIRLAARLSRVTMSEDPVQDLTSLGAAYVTNALDEPDLYRVMFDANFDLEDPQAADDTLHSLVHAVQRGKAIGRFRSNVDPLTLATQSWAIGHGLVSLVATGPLPREALAYGIPMLTALFVGAGDDPDSCPQSVERGWGRLLPEPATSRRRQVHDPQDTP
ncbi:putative transcriptional regulator, TetR family [Streptosporangium roseum DSM 43021]|uniref:Transcriptional regulator, TetR family n=1 Tax=Streptosporangium roseum (strain ATCC 12428 / DSM 43021 / JCM 3005 / KCTC 9067 / NCIMB 10171 / NRRL 2505 / NI 9100) TaxID=479432 RepID=D2AQZ8_STRRD|nr:putative transcriptional regulator, TetR family [Streptosporangium roseum DSM 43021]